MWRSIAGASTPAQERRAVASAMTLVVVAGSLSALGAIGAGPTLCPIALLTGTACPGCGMTRAVVELARGDLPASWDAHPLAVPVVAEAVVLLGLWGASVRGHVARQSTRWTSAAVGVTALGLVVVWFLRYASGTLPFV